MQPCILWCQVSAHADELFSVGLRGRDELGNPTAGNLGVSQTDYHEVAHFHIDRSIHTVSNLIGSVCYTSAVKPFLYSKYTNCSVTLTIFYGSYINYIIIIQY